MHLSIGNTVWAILICEHNSTFRSSFTVTRLKQLERERGRGHALLGKPMRAHRAREGHNNQELSLAS